MTVVRVIGIIVLVLGILGLIYGGFTYTEQTHDAELGPVEIRLEDKEEVNVPVWAGVLAVVVGGGMVVFGGRKLNPGTG